MAQSYDRSPTDPGRMDAHDKAMEAEERKQSNANGAQRNPHPDRDSAIPGTIPGRIRISRPTLQNPETD